MDEATTSTGRWSCSNGGSERDPTPCSRREGPSKLIPHLRILKLILTPRTNNLKIQPQEPNLTIYFSTSHVSKTRNLKPLKYIIASLITSRRFDAYFTSFSRLLQRTCVFFYQSVIAFFRQHVGLTVSPTCWISAKRKKLKPLLLPGTRTKTPRRRTPHRRRPCRRWFAPQPVPPGPENRHGSPRRGTREDVAR